MLRFEDCRKAGVIRKPHGTAGAVRIGLLPDIEIDLNFKEPVFLIMDGKPVPFFINRYQEAGGEPIIQFDALDSVEKAEELNGLDLYVNESSVILSHELTPAALIGYTIQDAEAGRLGPIISTFSSGLHDVLVMLYQEREVLVPFDPDLFEKVDEKAKILYADLPEGLVDLYLNDQEEE